ncbi:hypothetical protein, partial [Stieleria sp.]
MNASTSTAPRIAFTVFLTLFLLGMTFSLSHRGHAQDDAPQAKLSSSIAGDGTGTIVVEARGQIPDPPV